MENKLEKLTERLRSEGLEKGRAEGEKIVNDARTEAEKMIAGAEKKAEEIIAQAEKKAEELTKNTQNDVRMASLQTISALRSQIEGMVTAKIAAEKISEVWRNGEFLKMAIIEALKSWAPTTDTPVVVSLPEGVVKDIEGAIAGEFQSGVEVVFDGRTKVPFRIEPKEGGYYVDFTENDFQELVQQALRPKVSAFLFGQKGE